MFSDNEVGWLICGGHMRVGNFILAFKKVHTKSEKL